MHYKKLKISCSQFYLSCLIIWQWILHDWSDNECVNILKRYKETITSHGKKGNVIIIDAVINKEDEQDSSHSTTAKLLYDKLIMAHANGKERNNKEWENLFFEAGLSHYKISSSFGKKSLIEVYP